MLGSPQAAGEHRSTCRCRSCATNRVIGAMPGRRANGSGSYRSAVRLLPRVMRRHRIRSGTNTKRSGDVCSAAAATWKMPWTSSAGTTSEPGVSSAYPSPTRSTSTSPTTKGKAVIGGAPGGTNRRCRVPPGGSLRRRIVTERSLRAVNPAFGATPGIKSGRSAANRRSAPSRYAGAPARKNPHARWRVYALKGVETTPRTQPRFSANRTRAGFLVVEQRLTCG